jgi:branched-chain amino acid transport system substrate-binding protein
MGATKHRFTSGIGVAITLVLAAAGATACSGGAKASKQTGPIKVGYELPLTGNFAANGGQEKHGFELGLKEFGDTVNGRKIEVTYADTHGDPATALTTARKLVQDGVAVFEGPLVASEAAAVTPFLGQKKIPVDDLTLCSEIQLTTWNKYHNGMSSGWSCDQPSMTAALWAYNEMHWKKMAIVGQDFSFGWETTGGFGAAFKKLGGTISNAVYVPLNATDLSSYISQIPKDVDGVYVEMSGGFAVKFTAAYENFGLHKKVPLLGITQLTDQSVLPNESPTAVVGDVYTGAQYCDGIDTPENKKFVDSYKAAYNSIPGYYSEAGYVRAQLLIAALKAVKADTSDPAAVVKAMQSAKVTTPRGPLRISDKTFSPIQNNYICTVQQIDGVLRNVPIKTYTEVQPQGSLDYDAWLARFTHDGAARPTF